MHIRPDYKEKKPLPERGDHEKKTRKTDIRANASPLAIGKVRANAPLYKKKEKREMQGLKAAMSLR